MTEIHHVIILDFISLLQIMVVCIHIEIFVYYSELCWMIKP
jgi:hypothetical protein